MSPGTAKKPFDISIWKKSSQKRRQTIEKQRLRVLDEVNKAIQTLSGTYQWKALYLFGSITRSERFNAYSDIDIGIEGLEQLLHYRFLADLSGILGRSVDVVRLEDCPFSESIKERGIQWKKKN